MSSGGSHVAPQGRVNTLVGKGFLIGMGSELEVVRVIIVETTPFTSSTPTQRVSYCKNIHVR